MVNRTAASALLAVALLLLCATASEAQCCEGQNCPPPAEPAGTPSTECAATADWAPVCDANGTRVAVNRASAICAGYTAAQLSPCEPVQPMNEPADAPCACTFDYRPVCDCTGFVVAPNACSAECLGFDPEQFSPCSPSEDEPAAANDSRATASNETCVCPLIYAPVCDQYGKEVAPSACTADCQGIEYSAPCGEFSAFVQPDNPPQESCMCTFEYAPVCSVGTQHQLGSNACDAKCNGYSEQQFEPCFEPVEPDTSDAPECTVCTLEYFPQCLRNGTQVGANPCQATCAGYAGQFLPCAVVQAYEGEEELLVPSVLRPPCRCTKEYNPQCHVVSGALIGNNECNALCNGYGEAEMEMCERNDEGQPVLDAPVQMLCACPMIEAPVCDSMGTELGANACMAECKGYDPETFSEPNCENAATCDTPCTTEYLPVCDSMGTQLGSNACVARCLGYNETDFSEEYCTQKHLLMQLLPEIASRKEECMCSKIYRPVCDAQGTIVAANPCTARCAGYSDDSFSPCVFLALDNSTSASSRSSELQNEGALIRLANSTDVVDYQVLCVESPELNVTRICATFNSSIGFPEMAGAPNNNGTRNRWDDDDDDDDSSAMSGLRSAPWVLAFFLVVAVAQL